MKKTKRVVCILLSLLLLAGVLADTGAGEKTGSGMVQTVQAASITKNKYTGWKTVKGKRSYYQNGVIKKGFSKIGNDYYCFDMKGVLHTGWQYTGKHYRYFDKKSGKMKTNTTIQGRKIDRNGVWTPVVVLDPGHSGKVAKGYEPLGPGSRERKTKDTSGAQGCSTKVNEYQLTLNVAKKLQKELQNQGCKVILTRKDNKTAISCVQRARVANKAKADVYLRIHANDVDFSSANGALTISVSSRNRFVSRKMAKQCYTLSKTVLDSYVRATGCRKEYVWENDSMSGNNWSQVPTTLIELGYMSNPSEDRKMQTASYQKKMVKGLSDGIKKYLIS
ncbi:N-acetylmuramoyl-L-alanine amidase [Blautia sp. MSJ-19]|uniref:N-acetylmuramoyl-L-alanine amidase n=1 Tax=Blautia sp. MSJ-19 TaxID=2841517 RepID=UPI001C0EF40B|nr:N-acetylmuramoyl-L-alanine amidase [Blautia sp. MSJ-19]MBU5480957.1 N-acetylmuramoyl-L-alanine amidase [Blautia sp. MSJ-19]